jgi:hypothetical protein
VRRIAVGELESSGDASGQSEGWHGGQLGARRTMKLLCDHALKTVGCEVAST